jgi:hypothetical protein
MAKIKLRVEEGSKGVDLFIHKDGLASAANTPKPGPDNYFRT